MTSFMFFFGFYVSSHFCLTHVVF